jgi:hypothetical protein
MKEIILNPGAQERFVGNDLRASAFIGGLGSGKTFAMLARGLIRSMQPKRGFWGPRGCFAAINYPVLKDVVLPQFFELMDGSDLLLDYQKVEKKALLVPFNDRGEPDRRLVKSDGLGATEILFRSLDQPNWMRGLELAWFGIDEGRHLTGEAWDVLYGRLRQKGYDHAGWVCSTPNGFDWMWSKFHPDSPNKLKGSDWFGAPTTDNAKHLGDDYIESLMATYEGRFLRQEVYGEFVGVVDGAVFFAWDHRRHTGRVDYDPNLELYAFWDFGMGDLGVVEFAQLEWLPYDGGKKLEVPALRVLDTLEAKDRPSEEWAKVVIEHCQRRYGKQPRLHICDPAGRQRNVSTGTSIIDDMASFGIKLLPAGKKPIDHAVRILNNMLEGDRITVDSDRCERLAQALASHKWPIDSTGTRTGVRPVHDWTSHYADALRYGLTVLVSHGPRRARRPGEDPVEDQGDPYNTATFAHIDKLLREAEEQTQWLGSDPNPKIEWTPGRIGPRR